MGADPTLGQLPKTSSTLKDWVGHNEYSGWACRPGASL